MNVPRSQLVSLFKTLGYPEAKDWAREQFGRGIAKLVSCKLDNEAQNNLLQNIIRLRNSGEEEINIVGSDPTLPGADSNGQPNAVVGAEDNRIDGESKKGVGNNKKKRADKSSVPATDAKHDARRGSAKGKTGKPRPKRDRKNPGDAGRSDGSDGPAGSGDGIHVVPGNNDAAVPENSGYVEGPADLGASDLVPVVAQGPAPDLANTANESAEPAGSESTGETPLGVHIPLDVQSRNSNDGGTGDKSERGPAMPVSGPDATHANDGVGKGIPVSEKGVRRPARPRVEKGTQGKSDSVKSGSKKNGGGHKAKAAGHTTVRSAKEEKATKPAAKAAKSKPAKKAAKAKAVVKASAGSRGKRHTTEPKTSGNKLKVIPSIVGILEAAGKTKKPISKELILEKMAKLFPDRKASALKCTIGQQVPSKLRVAGYKVKKNELGYFI